ncbi:hypothetical protein LUX57_17470 [Actinomadura madurae]|nr:hypothetical protein [Actinomadura madurae]MCP9966673.1 hypothetical protein [Actinomadura madurae]
MNGSVMNSVPVPAAWAASVRRSGEVKTGTTVEPSTSLVCQGKPGRPGRSEKSRSSGTGSSTSVSASVCRNRSWSLVEAARSRSRSTSFAGWNSVRDVSRGRSRCWSRSSSQGAATRPTCGGRPSPSATCRMNQDGIRASMGRTVPTPWAGASMASHQRESGQVSAMSPNRTVMKCW